MDPNQILRIDKERMENGASAGEVLASLVKAFGDEQGAQMFQEYANTPLGPNDKRLRGQVNLGDPDEWR